MDALMLSPKSIEGIVGPLNLEKSSCPHCGSGSFVKHGKTGLGRQRYRCRECRKTFSETTGTPFMYSKKTLDTWASYLFCMQGRLTLRKISKLLRISLPTAFAWRHKILSVAETMTDNMLTDTVEVNEFCLKENFKGCRNIEPRFRGNNDRRLILFLSCRDSRGNILFRTAARKWGRKLDNKEVSDLLSPVVKGCKTIVTSSNLSFITFAKRNRVKLCMPYSANYRLKGFTLRAAEVLTRAFKGFLKNFRSVASKYLSHYVNWYRLMLEKGSLPAAILAMMACRRRKLRVYEFGKVQYDGSLKQA